MAERVTLPTMADVRAFMAYNPHLVFPLIPEPHNVTVIEMREPGALDFYNDWRNIWLQGLSDTYALKGCELYA